MFTELPAPDHVIAMRLSGKLTGDDLRQYHAILTDRLATQEQIAICVDFTGLSDLNGAALAEGMRADFELLSHLRQFARCAFVSDKEWPQVMIDGIGAVFPTLALKLFPPDQADAAILWAAEPPVSSGIEPVAFRFIPTSRDDVIAFEIDGLVTAEEMPGVIAGFEARLARHEKLRLLNRVKHFGGIDPAILLQRGLAAMKLAAVQKIERYAIVGAPGWMRKITELANPLFPTLEMRHFAMEQEADAWAWLGAEPKA